MPATAVAALAPAPSVATNVTAAFESANITKPDAFVRRVEAGVSAPVNPKGLVCVITLAGQGLTGPVDAASLDPASQATGLLDAAIACTGDDSAIIEGGSALSQFIANFTGNELDFTSGCFGMPSAHCCIHTACIV